MSCASRADTRPHSPQDKVECEAAATRENRMQLTAVVSRECGIGSHSRQSESVVGSRSRQSKSVPIDSRQAKSQVGNRCRVLISPSPLHQIRVIPEHSSRGHWIVVTAHARINLSLDDHSAGRPSRLPQGSACLVRAAAPRFRSPGHAAGRKRRQPRCADVQLSCPSARPDPGRARSGGPGSRQ